MFNRSLKLLGVIVRMGTGLVQLRTSLRRQRELHRTQILPVASVWRVARTSAEQLTKHASPMQRHETRCAFGTLVVLSTVQIQLSRRFA